MPRGRQVEGPAGDYLRVWLRSRRITSRIAHGIETSQRLGRHRWVIERSLAWLTGYRRLTLRYERPGCSPQF